MTDFLLGHDPVNIAQADESKVSKHIWFKALTLMVLPVQCATLVWSCTWFVSQDLNIVGKAGWFFSQGVISSILAINLAHELIHKDAKLETAFGGILLTSVGYYGFKIEHLRGHHVHVSMPEDASSARFGQGLWTFMPEAMFRNTRNAWKLEAEHLTKLGMPILHWRNEMLGWTLLWLVFCAAFYFSMSWMGLLFFCYQGLFRCVFPGSDKLRRTLRPCARKTPRWPLRKNHAFAFLEFGLRIIKFIVIPIATTFRPPAFPKRRYAILRHLEDSPQLPGGYNTMFVLALCPPLWHRVMDPRVRKFKEQLA